MFVQAVEDVLGDGSLQLPSLIAAAALQSGKILRAWCQDAANQCDFAIFLHYHLKGIEPNFLQGRKCGARTLHPDGYQAHFCHHLYEFVIINLLAII